MTPDQTYNGAEFEAAIDRLVDDLRSLDCEQVDPSIHGGEEDRSVLVQFDPREGSKVYVEGKEGDRFFYVRCYYDLIINLAKEFSDSQVEEIRQKETAQEYDDETIKRHLPSGFLGSDESEEDAASEVQLNRETIAAALDFVNNVEQDINDEIVFNLVDIFSRVPARFRVNSGEGGRLIGLVVRRRIFPYEDSYSITELNDAIAGVKAPAQMGILFFQKAFGLNIRRDEDEEDSEGPTPPVIPY